MLSARDISVTYGAGAPALDGVSLEVPRGEVRGLLGPNGAGKSTLLRVLATLQRPDAGMVTVAGVDAIESPGVARRHLGYLPQEFGFPPALTPYELLDHFALLKGLERRETRREAVGAMLTRVNLWADRTRPVKALSGGMTQRLGIAVALIGAPDVLVVDEPTVALDVPVRRYLWGVIRKLKQDGVTVILTTHYLEEAEALADRVCLLHKGQVLLVDSPDNLKTRFFAKDLESVFLALLEESSHA
jgi:ABC-type multidrug transport system ATPase subunit